MKSQIVTVNEVVEVFKSKYLEPILNFKDRKLNKENEKDELCFSF